MKRFEEFLVENDQYGDVFDLYVEGLLSRAAGWLGDKFGSGAQQLGQWGKTLQQRSQDPQSMIGPEAGTRMRQKVGGGLQKFGQWVAGEPKQPGAVERKMPTRATMSKTLDDAVGTFKQLWKQVQRSGDPQLEKEFRQLYGSLGQAANMARQRATAAAPAPAPAAAPAAPAAAAPAPTVGGGATPIGMGRPPAIGTQRAGFLQATG